MFELGKKVKVINEHLIENDDTLDKSALEIIQKNNFIGKVTKIMDDVYFVGFKNELGWVTQGFKASEIEEVK